MSASTQPWGSHLSPGQIRNYQRDGYLCPISVLANEEVAEYLDCYNAYVARNKQRLDALKANQRYLVMSQTHFVLPWVYRIASDRRILDAVETLLGPNLLAWDAAWFSKAPLDKAYVSWHQDGTYWNLRPPTVATAWLALTPSQPVTGCMRVIPGTHTHPLMPQRETYQPDNVLSRGQEIAVDVDESKAVDLALQPGQMSLHHIWIVHGSKANTSPTTPRIGLAIRYTTPEVTQDSPGKPLALLVRGEDRRGNFELLPAPSKELPPEEEAAAHARIVERIRSSLMRDARRKS